LVGIFIAVLVAGCGSGSNTQTTGAPVQTAAAGPKAETHVVVHETEFKLDPASANGGTAGLVAIKVVNDGKVAHSLAVDGPNGQVQLDGELEPGTSATLEADLDKPGTYTWYCPLDGHRGKGMTGTISVGGSSPERNESGGAATVTTTTGSTQTTPTQTQTQTQTTTQTQTQTQTETTTVTTPSTSTGPTATTGTPSGGY
jgi:uncharacterized cupredoxin-like copper-binding protein